MNDRKEEVKKLEAMAAFHTAKAEELEARIADVQALKVEAKRHRREAAAFAKKAEALKGKDEGAGRSEG